jgi:hypothetical protein
MKTFEQLIDEMAIPLPQHKGMTFYHGSNLNDSQIKEVLSKGLDPKHTEIKYKDNEKSAYKPVQNHIYVTLNRAMALVYACGGNWSESGSQWSFYDSYEKLKDKDFFKGKKAVVFVIDGDTLYDIYPDEDEIGQFLYKILNSKEELNSYKKSIYNLAKSNLTSIQLDNVKKYDDHKYLVSAGKTILPKMSDNDIYYIISQSSNLSNKGNIIPESAYVLDYADFDKVKTISDYFRVAKVVKG